MKGTTIDFAVRFDCESIPSQKHVEGDEDSGEQAREAVDVLDGEPRPALEARPAGHEQAERDRSRDEDVGDDARRAGRVPVDGERRDGHAAASSGDSARCQLALTSSSPPSSRKRPGSCRSSSHSGPASPRRKAALAAMSA